MKKISEAGTYKEFDIDEASRDDGGFYTASIHTPEDPFWQNIHVIEKQAYLDLMVMAEKMAAKLTEMAEHKDDGNAEGYFGSMAADALADWQKFKTDQVPRSSHAAKASESQVPGQE